MADGRSLTSGTPDGSVQHDLFHIGEDLPPAMPERAAWGTAPKLRQWQQEALERYLQTAPQDFLTVATPGAGKTTFALRVAKILLDSGVVQRLTVVAPTDHLKRQWADNAARVGIAIDPNFKNADGRHGAEYRGVALTYAQVANKPVLHRNRTEAAKTLVILDEIHHGGDALSWGEGIREAFEPATRRLSLTGTPFRSDTASIPFVRYELGADGIERSKADYTYGYGPALRDHVVRPVIFMAYSGQMRWKTSTGEVMEAQLGEAATKDITASAWRTALDPAGEWIPSVLRAADRRLSEVRRNVPDAGGLVIATDHQDARAYAAQLEALTGQRPAVILSDDKGASDRIEEFAASDERWMVAVRMVSEGVDVPRLCVGVYATSTSTPLFFAQAVGRFVRSRRRGETASVFLPSVPVLLQLASQMEAQRDHVLGKPHREEGLEDQLLAQANQQQDENTEDELAADNAAALHLREQQALEQRRAQLLSLGAGGSLGALLGRWRERTRLDFLRGQPLRSGAVPGLGPRELGLVVAQGIRTALERWGLAYARFGHDPVLIHPGDEFAHRLGVRGDDQRARRHRLGQRPAEHEGIGQVAVDARHLQRGQVGAIGHAAEEMHAVERQAVPDLGQHLGLPAFGVRRLAAIAAGATPVADLRLDPCKPRKTSNAVGTTCLSLIEKVVMKLAVAIDPATFRPGIADELRLTRIFQRPLAEWILQPGVETAGSDTKATAHRPNRELLAMLGYERVSHFASLAKYAVAFFKMSRSIFTRDNSVRRRLISICSALTAGVAELFNPPLPAALTQLCSVCSDRPRFLATVATRSPPVTRRTASSLNSSV